MYAIKINGRFVSTYTITNLKGNADVTLTDNPAEALTQMTEYGAKISADLLRPRVEGTVEVVKLSD